MNYFMAANAKQLDLCLRMLYADNIVFFVNIVESNKGKITYRIGAEIDDQTYKKLLERYRILVS
jgi:hypothetical protein